MGVLRQLLCCCGSADWHWDADVFAVQLAPGPTPLALHPTDFANAPPPPLVALPQTPAPPPCEIVVGVEGESVGVSAGVDHESV